MKKLISTLALIAIMVVLTTTMVSATSANTLVDDAYALAAKYKINISNARVEIERYLADNPITDAQAEQVYAKAQAMAKIMDDAGAKSYKDLNKEQRNQIRALANEAASILGVTLTFKDGVVTVYKDGKQIGAISLNGKLAYTGNNVNSILVVSSIAVLALATGLVAKRKFANA